MEIRSIVLTGGPGAGKTSVAAALSARWPARFAVVAEAATQVYERLGTCWADLDVDGRRDVQRRIYELQLDQERRLQEMQTGKTLLLDRGTVDGAAYWPDGAEDYWRVLKTSHEAELRRYDAVIWLQSSAALGSYDGTASNPWRSEPAAAAVELDERLERLWQGHRNFRRVRAFPQFEQKLEVVYAVLERLAG
jgi:predicted ATPase